MSIEHNAEQVPVSEKTSTPRPAYAPQHLSDVQVEQRQQEQVESNAEAELLLAGLDKKFHPKGKISYYGTPSDGFGYEPGKMLTASGEKFNPMEKVAAHLGLPFGTEVKVSNPVNGKSVIVRINDRGPYVADREFDLSYGAFKEIADPKKGVIDAVFTIVSRPSRA